MRDISARELKGHNILAVERFWAVSYTHLVRHNIGAVHLHQIGFQPESGLTGTGAANHQYIFVSGSLGAVSYTHLRE